MKGHLRIIGTIKHFNSISIIKKKCRSNLFHITKRTKNSPPTLLQGSYEHMLSILADSPLGVLVFSLLSCPDPNP